MFLKYEKTILPKSGKGLFQNNKVNGSIHLTFISLFSVYSYSSK